MYRLATPLDRVVHWKDRDLLPPAHLRIYYYGTWDPKAFARARDDITAELTNRGLRRSIASSTSVRGSGMSRSA